MQVVGQIVGLVDAHYTWAANFACQAFEGQGVAGVRGTNDHHGIDVFGDVGQRCLAVGSGKTKVAAARSPHIGKAQLHRVGNSFPFAMRQRRLGQQCNGFAELIKGSNFVEAFHP